MRGGRALHTLLGKAVFDTIPSSPRRADFEAESVVLEAKSALLGKAVFDTISSSPRRADVAAFIAVDWRHGGRALHIHATMTTTTTTTPPWRLSRWGVNSWEQAGCLVWLALGVACLYAGWAGCPRDKSGCPVPWCWCRPAPRTTIQSSLANGLLEPRLCRGLHTYGSARERPNIVPPEGSKATFGWTEAKRFPSSFPALFCLRQRLTARFDKKRDRHEITNHSLCVALWFSVSFNRLAGHSLFVALCRRTRRCHMKR